MFEIAHFIDRDEIQREYIALIPQDSQWFGNKDKIEAYFGTPGFRLELHNMVGDLPASLPSEIVLVRE